MNTVKFGERVAALRKSRNLTQAQLAEQLNVSNKTISRWETGDGYPEITLLMPLAKALGVSVDTLLEDDDKNNEENTKDTDDVNPFQKAAGKEYKHKDIPVVWPEFKFSLNINKNKIINHAVNLLFFIVTAVLYYIVAEFRNFSTIEWTLGQIATDGSGYFCVAWKGYILIAVTFLLYVGVLFFNIKAKSKEWISSSQIVKNVVISTGFTIVMLFNFTYITGKNNFHSPSYSWINGYEESTFLHCDFFEFNLKIIMLTMLISSGVYVLGEIIICIIKHIKLKKTSEHKDMDTPNHDVASATFRDFWNSLTIFNKFGFICVVLDLICVVIALVLSILVQKSFMVVPIIVMLPSIISKVGLSFSALGLGLGFLDMYDRQFKASIIIVIINLAAIYILPLLFTLISVVGFI